MIDKAYLFVRVGPEFAEKEKCRARCYREVQGRESKYVVFLNFIAY